MLVPVKAFADAKARLAPVLDHGQRERLSRWSAERVLRAADGLATYVVCDDAAVAAWADDLGAQVVWRPGVGLNAAVNSAVAELRDGGAEYVIVAHGDLPRAHSLGDLVIQHTVVLVPDARADGTNVVVLPTQSGFQLAYGAGSFRRHLALATQSGLPVAVRRDPMLALDLDVPADLSHPLVQEVLPTWISTEPARTAP